MGRRESNDRRTIVSSIPGEKRELHPVTWGRVVKALNNTIMKSNVILWLY